jgi:hypothetical protein
LLLVIYEPVGKLSEMAFTPSMGGIFFSFNRFQFVHDQVVEEEKRAKMSIRVPYFIWRAVGRD